MYALANLSHEYDDGGYVVHHQVPIAWRAGITKSTDGGLFSAMTIWTRWHWGEIRGCCEFYWTCSVGFATPRSMILHPPCFPLCCLWHPAKARSLVPSTITDVVQRLPCRRCSTYIIDIIRPQERRSWGGPKAPNQCFCCKWEGDGVWWVAGSVLKPNMENQSLFETVITVADCKFCHTKYVLLKEQLAIFPYFAVIGVSNWNYKSAFRKVVILFWCELCGYLGILHQLTCLQSDPSYIQCLDFKKIYNTFVKLLDANSPLADQNTRWQTVLSLLQKLHWCPGWIPHWCLHSETQLCLPLQLQRPDLTWV